MWAGHQRPSCCHQNREDSDIHNRYLTRNDATLRLENTEAFLGLVEADKIIGEALAITLINAQVNCIMALVPLVLVNCSSKQLTKLSEQLPFWDKDLVAPSGQSIKACQ